MAIGMGPSAAILAVGLILVGAGIGFIAGVPKIAKSRFKDRVVIDNPNHKNYQTWTTNTDEGDSLLHYHFSLWNLTNPDEFTSGDAKPHFELVGPFSYRRDEYKRNISFSADGDEVSFRYHVEYEFVPERSGAGITNDDVKIFNVNPFYIVALQSAGNSETVLNFGFAVQAIAAAGFYTNTADWASNISFEGAGTTPTYAAYVAGTSPTEAANVQLTQTEAAVLVRMTSTATMATYAGYIQAYFAAVGAGQTATATAVATAIEASYPNGPSYTSFTTFGGQTTTKAAVFVAYLQAIAAAGRTAAAAAYGANGKLLFRELTAKDTIFGPDPFLNALGSPLGRFQANMTDPDEVGNEYTLKTGKLNEQQLGMDFYVQSNGFTESTAYGETVQVNGRTSTHDSFVKGGVGSTIPIWFEDLERYLNFNKVEDADIKYSNIPVDRFSADTEAALVEGSRWNVTWEGYAPLAYFANGAPLFISRPHQGSTDAIFSNATSGQSYDPAMDVHATYLDIEPMTGVGVRAHQRVQNNLFLNFSAVSYADAPNVLHKEVMIPIYVLDKNFYLAEDSTNALHRATVYARQLRFGLFAGCLVPGAILFLAGLALVIVNVRAPAAPAAEEPKKTEPVEED